MTGLIGRHFQGNRALSILYPGGCGAVVVLVAEGTDHLSEDCVQGPGVASLGSL
jgi:hypothetical protein